MLSLLFVLHCLPGEPATFVEDVRILHTWNGEAAGDQFGWIGRNAGDANGDGVPDVWISAPFKVVGGGQAGRCYLYSGKDAKLLFEKTGRPGDQLGIGLDAVGDVDGDGRADVVAGAAQAGGTGEVFVYAGADGAVLFHLKGEGKGDRFGRKVAGAGDQDGDGHADVIVGAPLHDGTAEDAGRAYLFSGADGNLICALDGEANGDHFGSCVDGYSDGKTRLLIVGAENAGPGDRGRVYVYRFDDDASELAFVIESEPDDTSLGRMFVSAVGDVDADGVVDVYASDWNSNANGKRGSGRIYIHSGKTGKRLFEWSGETAGEGFGIGTAEAGDADGDGHDDVLVGAWQHGSAAPGGGRCTLFSGKTGEPLRTLTCSTPGETFGFDTTSMGDLDGDGKPDFLITAGYSGVAGKQSGRAFVVAGE